MAPALEMRVSNQLGDGKQAARSKSREYLTKRCPLIGNLTKYGRQCRPVKRSADKSTTTNRSLLKCNIGKTCQASRCLNFGEHFSLEVKSNNIADRPNHYGHGKRKTPRTAANIDYTYVGLEL